MEEVGGMNSPCWQCFLSKTPRHEGEIDISEPIMEQVLVLEKRNEVEQERTVEQDVIEDKNETVINMIKYGDNCDNNLIV